MHPDAAVPPSKSWSESIDRAPSNAQSGPGAASGLGAVARRARCGERPREQDVLEAEARQVAHPHREEITDQVIALVLYDAGVESVDGAVDRRTVRVETAVAESAEARHDLGEIGRFIGRDNPTRARSFVIELQDVANRLVDAPRGYPLVPRYEHHGIRRRSWRGYAIFYSVNEDLISVINILGPGQDHEQVLGLK